MRSVCSRTYLGYFLLQFQGYWEKSDGSEAVDAPRPCVIGRGIRRASTRRLLVSIASCSYTCLCYPSHRSVEQSVLESNKSRMEGILIRLSTLVICCYCSKRETRKDASTMLRMLRIMQRRTCHAKDLSYHQSARHSSFISSKSSLRIALRSHMLRKIPSSSHNFKGVSNSTIRP